MNTHLIYIPFTSVGLYGGYRGNDWYKERIEIFKSYTLQSLKNQTNQQFIIWMSFRPEEENNYLTKEISKSLQQANLRYVFTFDGLMYHDDKFSDGFKNKFMNIARVIRGSFRNRTFKYLISNIGEIYINKNSTLEHRLEHSLSTLEPYFSKSEWITITRIDSDDMFHKQAVGIIQEFEPFIGALVCGKGLIYNTETKELANWNPPTNPPFHTIFLPSSIFFNARTYLLYFGQFSSHEDIPKIFDTKKLPDYLYCVTTHNPKNHISTLFNHPFRGKMVDSSLINNYL